MKSLISISLMTILLVAATFWAVGAQPVVAETQEEANECSDELSACLQEASDDAEECLAEGVPPAECKAAFSEDLAECREECLECCLDATPDDDDPDDDDDDDDDGKLKCACTKGPEGPTPK